MEYQLISPINQNYSAVEQILTNRGMKCEDIQHYLHTTDEDILPPSLIANIDDAVKMILRHLSDDKRIMVVVDSDCDGFTSAAALLNYLYVNFSSIVLNKFYYVFHDGKQHGIELNMIEPGIGLVIAPDSSSNDYEIHKELKEHGIDVLVIDHHQAEMVSPNACVVNNQLCDYPTKSLSGVGMVYKLCQRFDELCGFNNADDLLDLAAVGIIADMMDLRSFEVRRIIEKGLSKLKNPFLRAMRDKNAFKLGYDQITPIGIAFYIAPFVNAVNRVGTQQEKLVLFESMLTWKAHEQVPSTKRGAKGTFEEIVDQAVRTCTNVKNRQGRSRDSNLETIENIIKSNHLLDKKLLIVKLDGFSVDRNLSGLIANQLMAKYQRPVAILNKIIDHETQIIRWEGSARGYEKSKITDFREFVRESGFAYLAEGHPNAFGIGFTDDNLNKFISHSENVLQDVTFEPSYKVDFIWQANDFKAKDVTEIGGLESYWGQDIAESYVAIEGVNVTGDKVSRYANNTLKITLPNGVACMKFKSSEEEFELFDSPSGCVTINLVGKCQNNNFNGMITPQILIEDYEIIKRQEYYF